LPSSSLPEQLIFFFEPIQFHLELADLLEKLSFKFLPAFLRFLPAVGKEIRHHLQKMPTPLPDLVGMDVELARQLGESLLPFGRFERDFGLECGVMLSSHVDHLTIPPFELWQVKMHLIALSEIWGEAQSTKRIENESDKENEWLKYEF
jgi:hypothetical protein